MRAVRIVLFLGLAAAAHAALVRLETVSRTPMQGYERILAKAHFAVDPRAAANRAVVDIDLAPRNDEGQVEFTADVLLLRPEKPNGTLLLDIPNRGGARAASAFDQKFLMQQGYTVAEVGWQFDLLGGDGLLRLYVPQAIGVRGPVRAAILVNRPSTRQPVAEPNHRPYPVLDPGSAVLTVRERADLPARTIPKTAWRIEGGDTVVLDQGFEPGLLYELVYTSSDPPLSGLGMAAVRDLASWVKYGGEYRGVQRALGFGISQSGRFLRNFLYCGFNRDEKDRRVFEGIWANVAGGGIGSFNVRFAQEGRVSGAHSNPFYPVDLFPFTDLEETDPVTGIKDGLLTHALRPQDRPRIFYTYSSHEYYGRSAALIHISPDGKKDAALPADTRIYFFAGGTHGPAGFPPPSGTAQNLGNPNPYTLCFRALLTAMNSWISDGTAPPDSVYPRIARRELVAPGEVKFPNIPGVARPLHLQTARRENFGPEFRAKGISSIEPPSLGGPFPVLVPQADADGNDLGGIRMPEISEPLGSYTGWNLRTGAMGAAGELVSLAGSWIPFPRSKAEPDAAADPRLSIEERYPGKAEYLKRFEAAARDLVKARFLLESDVPALLNRGAAEWDYSTRPPAR